MNGRNYMIREREKYNSSLKHSMIHIWGFGAREKEKRKNASRNNNYLTQVNECSRIKLYAALFMFMSRVFPLLTLYTFSFHAYKIGRINQTNENHSNRITNNMCNSKQLWEEKSSQLCVCVCWHFADKIIIVSNHEGGGLWRRKKKRGEEEAATATKESTITIIK